MKKCIFVSANSKINMPRERIDLTILRLRRCLLRHRGYDWANKTAFIYMMAYNYDVIMYIISNKRFKSEGPPRFGLSVCNSFVFVYFFFQYFIIIFRIFSKFFELDKFVRQNKFSKILKLHILEPIFCLQFSLR